MTTRTFHLGDVLSITTGRLVSLRHIEGVYDILNFMTGDSLFTHQLPRGAEVCRPALLAQFPELADVPVPETFADATHVETWLHAQMRTYGGARDVAPLSADAWTQVDPMLELRAMLGEKADEKIIVADVPADAAPGREAAA